MDSNCPQRKVGLTGDKVALAMVQHQWRPFGVLSVITSDQGSQFVGSWWQTLCGALGVRFAFSQAYNHRANGRAEKAGQQIFERLRRERFEQGLTWVDVLPQLLDRIHYTPARGRSLPKRIW